MENKLDYIVEKIGSIDKTLEFQAIQLKEHIKRTNILEERITPIEDHVKFIRKLMSAITWLATIMVPVLALISYLKH